MKNIFKLLGAYALTIAVFVVVAALAGVFLLGTAWLSEKVLPVLNFLLAVTFFALILIALPLSIFRKCRRICGRAFVYWGDFCGLALLLACFLVTINLWGFTGAIIGLMFGGIGIVPVALLASVFKGEWVILIELVLQLVLVAGSIFFGSYLDSKADNENVVPQSTKYENETLQHR